jgi:hypothetical protein
MMDSMALVVAECASMGALLLAIRLRRGTRPPVRRGKGKKLQQSRSKSREANGDYHAKKAQRRSKFNSPNNATHVPSDGRFEEITDPDHEALQHYHDLKDHTASYRDGLFIAEGPETIKMLLRSKVEVLSLLLKPTLYAKLADEIDLCHPRPRVLVCSASLMSSVVGKMSTHTFAFISVVFLTAQ